MILQESFKAELLALLRHVPEVLQDDPVEEAARSAQIEKVRDLIARRWMAIRTIASTWHHDQLEEIVAATKACILDLLTIHGPEIPFAPDPEVPKVNGGVPEEESKSRSGRRSSGSETSTSTSAVSATIPHEFRFLRTKVGVWTCLRVTHFLVNHFPSVDLCFGPNTRLRHPYVCLSLYAPFVLVLVAR